MPLLLIFYLTLFSLSFGSIAAQTSMTLTISSITAILAYRFVIESVSPRVGYFMLSDYLFFLFLLATCLIFFLNIVDYFTTKITTLQKTIAVALLHCFVVGVTSYLFVLW